jgi:hypothetical protein
MNIITILKASKNLTEKDQLSMILSNRIDMGSAEGGLISVKQFDVLIEDLIEWKNQLKDELEDTKKVKEIKC